MKRFIVRTLLLLLLAGLGALAYWQATKIEVIDVLVKPVEYGPVERIVTNTRAGTVEACKRSSPTPSVGGQIARLEVEEGDSVEEGQLLLELWNEDVKAEVSLAQSQHAEAKSVAQATCLDAEVAQREADRLIPLHERGGASADQTDKAVTEAKARAARCEAAKSVVMVSESRLAVAKAKVARTQLTAPFSGVVATVTGDLLQYVTPSPPGIPTPPIFDIIANDCFYVTAPIDEVDAPNVLPGLPARIKLDAFPDIAFEGSVRRVAPFVQDYEKQARTVDIEVAFENEADMAKLLAGYSADVEVVIEIRDRVLRVPTEGVIDGKRLFVLDAEDAVLREREVSTGLSNWDHTEVLQGVAQGDLVVTSVDAPGVEDGARATNTSGLQ